MTLSKVRSAVADVSELLGTLTDLQASDAAPHGSQRAVDLYLRQTSAEAVERRQLLLALHEAEWNLARVARMLGVTRVTVYKRMRRHGIERLKVRKTRVAPAKTEG
jgi:transcriptional regulator of acetoin/glycerol metabolism